MSGWTGEELDRIGAAEELEITARRADGTLGDARTIWVVRSGDRLFVRAQGGPTSAWYLAMTKHHEGHVSAGGVARDVTFIEADGAAHPGIDVAYREKYHDASAATLDLLTGSGAHAATLEIHPR